MADSRGSESWHRLRRAAGPTGAAFSARDPVEDLNAAVLVVEDTIVPPKVLDLFRKAGYTAVRVQDRHLALRVLGTLRFDAIVVNVALSEGEIVALLSALPAGFPVVVVSGIDLERRALRRVASANLTMLRRPVDPEVLLGAVERATRLRRSLRRRRPSSNR